MIVKKHSTRDGRLVLAVCDSELVCQKFEDEKFVLDLDSDFYKGEKMDEDKILELMKHAYIVNLVGEKSINLGLKAGIIDKTNIIKVKGIKHAQGVCVAE